MSSSFAMFDWLLLAVSVYVLYSGIVGKGKLYSVENIKEGKQEEFKALSRKIYIFLGIAMVINSAASLLRNTFYAYQEITPATETAKAVYGWVTIKELGAFSFLTAPVFDIISYVALALTLGLIVFLVVKMRKYVDKTAQSKASQGPAARSGSSMPSSAFNFDEEDKKGQ
ncbi:MAG: hypothetical protein ABFC56_01890 [Clostridiaceae bacterium]